ncbi:hypothetical protein NP233_g2461 [Leucocoprinus birnbaumii]|uniref:NADH:flavin oxidoreductase/NADH oxidase N-terminal domain-containing protein n=1 Tax=Leucocoprinus birnbaumii TaxID=56174 RepID=A0AAD5W1C3_9AGAR|nr:hypothetical protein NP233_g2461 [Leucocoprinus birnbaumii]
MNTRIFSPYEFPCGLKANNRLVKAPLYEHLSDFLGGPPNPYHFALYSSWARHNWGMIITGNVQISRSHLTLGRDLVVPDLLTENSVKPYKRLSQTIKGPSCQTLAIMQLSHAGRQSSNFIGGRYPFEPPLAPSAVSVGSRALEGDLVAETIQSILFQTPKEMSPEEVDEVVESFIKGALFGYNRCQGLDGVELHVAHGYYLPEISVNAKTRAQDPEEARALRHVLALAAWGTVDFIDVSGGDYENPEFMTTDATKRGRRQAFFANFARKAVKSIESLGRNRTPRPAIMLTGGLRTPALLQSALQSNQADLAGIGRCSIICPHIPEIMASYEQGLAGYDGDTLFGAEPEIPTPMLLGRGPLASFWISVKKVKVIGAGLNMAWYTLVLRRIARAELQALHGLTLPKSARGPDYSLGVLRILFQLYFWVPNPGREARGSILAHFDLFTAIVTGLFSASGAPTTACSECTVQNPAALMNLPSGFPAAAYGLSYVAVAIGTQNYTCSSTGTYTLNGALADLFDISCLAKSKTLFDKVTDAAIAIWQHAPPNLSTKTVMNGLQTMIKNPIFLGQHYYVTNPITGTGVNPMWDFTSSSATRKNSEAYVVAAKSYGSAAPTGTQDIDWVYLTNIGAGELANVVYRTDTKLGQPPASCTPGSDPLYVKYAAKYWLYGGSIAKH